MNWEIQIEAACSYIFNWHTYLLLRISSISLLLKYKDRKFGSAFIKIYFLFGKIITELPHVAGLLKRIFFIILFLSIRIVPSHSITLLKKLPFSLYLNTEILLRRLTTLRICNWYVFIMLIIYFEMPARTLDWILKFLIV